MSRTDKDKPLWVRAEWWTARHWACDHPSAWLPDPSKPCTLPDRPALRHPTVTARGWRVRSCEWKPVDGRRNFYRSPTREELRLEWHGPYRAHMRDRCRIAVQQHRGGGPVDTPAPLVIGDLYWD